MTNSSSQRLNRLASTAVVDFVGLASAVFFQCLRQAVDEYVEIGVCAVPSGYK